MNRVERRVELVLLAAFALSGCASAVARDRVIDYLALCSAATTGDELLAKALLARGAPVNPPGPDTAGDLSYFATLKNTPLQAAAEFGHHKIVEILIAHGAWLDAQCCDSLTPLGLAARGGHVESVKILLRAGADPKLPGAEGTPLQVAEKYGHTEVVRILASFAR